MDAKTFSTLSVLVSGPVEDLNRYEQVIGIAIRPDNPQELQDLADLFTEAFDSVFRGRKRPVYMDRQESRQVLNRVIKHLDKLGTLNAQCAKVCLTNTISVLDRFPPKY